MAGRHIRYNTTTKYFEYSLSGTAQGPWSILDLTGHVSAPVPAPPLAHSPTHQPGGSDPLTNNAWLNAANVFTQGQVISAGNPSLGIRDSISPANTKNWNIASYGNGNLYFDLLNDALAAYVARPLRLDATGQANFGGPVVSGGNVTVNKVRPEVQLQVSSGLGKAHLMSVLGGGRIDLGCNIYYDGTAWVRDDIAGAGSLMAIDPSGAIGMYKAPAGANPAAITPLMSLDGTGKLTTTAGLADYGRATPISHWTAWTPVIVNDGGTGLTYGGINCKYMIIGKTLFYQIYVDSVTNSTDSNYIRLTVPVPIVGDYTGHFMTRVFWSFQGHQVGYSLPAATTGTINCGRTTDGFAAWLGGTYTHIYQCGGQYQIA